MKKRRKFISTKLSDAEIKFYSFVSKTNNPLKLMNHLKEHSEKIASGINLVFANEKLFLDAFKKLCKYLEIEFYEET